jgi:hypothetical protein
MRGLRRAIAAATSVVVALALMVGPAYSAFADSCYTGARKFVYTEPEEVGGQHHVVEFDVDSTLPDDFWYIAETPMLYPFDATLWPGYYGQMKKWLSYRWPYDWSDPYSASSWKICHR